MRFSTSLVRIDEAHKDIEDNFLKEAEWIGTSMPEMIIVGPKKIIIKNSYYNNAIMYVCSILNEDDDDSNTSTYILDSDG